MPARTDLPTKRCATCGRSFSWRKSWAEDWDSVRYCSKGCRSHRPGDRDRQLERAILALLEQRQPSATICPSEAARLVDADDWRDLMEPARRAARRLEAEGRVIITQRGKRVDPGAAGPIRVGRAR